MPTCVAYKCSQTPKKNSGISFFRFPSDGALMKTWVLKMHRLHFNVTTHSRLCSQHFTRNQFERDPEIMASYGYDNAHPKLKPDAVPTLFRHNHAASIWEEGSETGVMSCRGQKNKANFPMGSRPAFIKRQRQEVLNELLRGEDKFSKCSEVAPIGASSEGAPVKEADAEAAPVKMNLPHDENQGAHDSDATKIQSATKCSQVSFKPYQKTRRIQVRPTTIDKAIHCAPSCREVAVQCDLLLPPNRADIEPSDGSIRNTDDDERDVDFLPEQMSDDSESDSDSIIPPVATPLRTEIDCLHTEKQFLVSERSLAEIMGRCSECGMPATPYITRYVGTMVVVNIQCVEGHTVTWNRQQGHKRMPWGNLLCASAILFSGSNPSKIITFFSHLNIPIFSLRTYSNIQRNYLIPTVVQEWDLEQNRILDSLKGIELSVGGDARCDSPGHTAKYGTYNLMDLDRCLVLATHLVQSNEVANSSRMELEGLKRGIKRLEESGCIIKDLVTDRHPQVKKFMRDEQKEKNHFYDVWHFAKGVTKKIKAASKKKGCTDLSLWQKPISNQIYWIAASSGDNGDIKHAKWQSIVPHIGYVHEGHGDFFPTCAHGPLTDRKWLKPGSRPYKVLDDILSQKMLSKDVRQLSPVHQTYGLEVFHNIVNHFAPKSTHFFYHAMLARMYLAALHFNENGNKAQATTKSGEKIFRKAFPKAYKGSEAVVKPVKVKSTYGYVTKLKAAVIQRRLTFDSYKKARLEATQILPVSPGFLTNSNPTVSKQDLIAKHKSRFRINDN